MATIKTNFGEEGIILFTTEYGQYAIFADHIRPEDGVNGERYYSLAEAKIDIQGPIALNFSYPSTNSPIILNIDHESFVFISFHFLFLDTFINNN